MKQSNQSCADKNKICADAIPRKIEKLYKN